MSADAAPSTIPTPDALAKRQLTRAPRWLQRLASNTLALIAWIGLPSTVLSTLGNMQFVLDGALWLYRHAGALRPVFEAAGEWIATFVQAWRALTHPIWQTLFGWLQITLPSWAPDLLTLALLIVAGFARRIMTTTLADIRSTSLMAVGRARASPSVLQPIPPAFPYREHFEGNGFKLTPARLRDTERLWRSWRARQIRMARVMSKDSGPWLFPEGAVRAQFGRFWLGVRQGRQTLLVYSIAVGMLAIAFGIEWANRVGLFL